MANKIYVSIPQAVSTVATIMIFSDMSLGSESGFNTASGKHCCNISIHNDTIDCFTVSIPQAVSTVATLEAKMQSLFFEEVSIPQAVSTVATPP